jgi:hypothetical protein
MKLSTANLIGFTIKVKHIYLNFVIDFRGWGHTGNRMPRMPILVIFVCR